MLNEYDLVNSMKVAGSQAAQAAKPTEMSIGTVISVSPLKIQIDQKLTLSTNQLVVPRSLTDYKLKVDYDLNCSVVLEHSHEIKGTKEIKVYNALKNGDKVILARQQGGQKYFVIDKVVE